MQNCKLCNDKNVLESANCGNLLLMNCKAYISLFKQVNHFCIVLRNSHEIIYQKNKNISVCFPDLLMFYYPSSKRLPSMLAYFHSKNIKGDGNGHQGIEMVLGY